MVQGVSKVQLEWLMWLQTQPICLDSKGVRQQIQHAMNFGEVKVNGKPVDGYMVKDGVAHSFEFYGCYFHPGCCVPDAQIFNAENRRKEDEIKINELQQKGKHS